MNFLRKYFLDIVMVISLIVWIALAFFIVGQIWNVTFELKVEGWTGIIIGSFIGWSINYFSSKKQIKIIRRASEKIIVENLRRDRSEIELNNPEARFKRYRSGILSRCSFDNSLRLCLKFVRIQLNENDIDYGQRKDNNEDFHGDDVAAATRILSEFDEHQKKDISVKYCFGPWFFDRMNKNPWEQYNDFFFREREENMKSFPAKHIWCSCTIPKSKDFTLYDFGKGMEKLYRELDFSFGIHIDDYLEKEKYDNNFCDLLEDIRKSPPNAKSQ